MHEEYIEASYRKQGKTTKLYYKQLPYTKKELDGFFDTGYVMDHCFTNKGRNGMV